MMIKFLVSIASASYAYGPDSPPVEWLDEAEAARFVARGVAAYVTPARESAALKPAGKR